MDYQEYLRETFKVIRENFRSNDLTGGMTAASAAYLVKRYVGDHRDFGFPKFKDVLTVLVRDGRLTTGTNSKDAFSLWLTDDPSSTAKPVPSSGGFRPLRNQVWIAFVAAEPAGNRYLQHMTGEVRVGCSESPGDSWIEIRPISPDEERQFIRQFLLANHIDEGEFQGVIDGQRWYIDFPQQLAVRSPHLAVAWKRARSSRVIEHVKNWCDEKKVDPEIVFENFVQSKAPSAVRFAQSGRNLDHANGDLRRALLDAIQRMSTDDLLRISIPATHLIAVLRTDLLR